MKTDSVRLALGLVGIFATLAGPGGSGAELRNLSRVIDRGGLPPLVHVFEDYETDIEKRWWLRGVPETNNVAPSLSDSVANRRACRAMATKDFDDKMGLPTMRCLPPTGCCEELRHPRSRH